MWRRGRTEVLAPADGIISRRMARVGGYRRGRGRADVPHRRQRRGRARRRGDRDAHGRRQDRPGRTRRGGRRRRDRRQGAAGLARGRQGDPARPRAHLSWATTRPAGRRASPAASSRRPRAAASPCRPRPCCTGPTVPPVQVVRDRRVETRPDQDRACRSAALAEVREGLSEGELVVSRSGTFLRDGDAVRPVMAKSKVSEAHRMNWNISAWSIRQPVPSLVLFMVLIALGYVSFGQLADHALSQHRRADRAGARLPVGRGPLRARGAGHQEDRGRHRRRERRQAPDLGRSPKAPRSPPSSSASRSIRTAPSTTSRMRSRASAPSCRAPSTSRSSPRIEIEGLPIVTYAARAPGMTPEQLSWFVDDIDHARAAGREGRVADRALRRRRARDPHRARSRPAARLRHHGGRRQPAAAGHQRRPGGRARRDRRARAGDPHARRQAVGRGPRRHHDRAAEGPQGAPRPARHRERRHGRAAHVRGAGRQGRRGIRHLARQGRERRGGCRRRAPRRSRS